jgi:glycosyltransferase involved in cell wall biosynthesis
MSLVGIGCEETSEKPRILYCKPGLGTGGATFADILLLEQCVALGIDVSIATGFVKDDIRAMLQERGIHQISIHPRLERSFQDDSPRHPYRIAEEITGELVATGSNVLLFSQAFAGDVPKFAEAVVILAAAGHKMIQRQHDPVRLPQLYAKLPPTGVALPTTTLLRQQVQAVNPDLPTVVAPPCIDDVRLSNAKSSQEIRAQHGLAQNDILLVQPSRVDTNKGVGKAVLAAHLLGRRYPDRGVHLFVTGGGRSNKQRSVDERDRVEAYAASIGFDNLVFFEGQRSSYDYIMAADFITFMSSVEGWGLPPAEAAYLRKPVITTSYTDPLGNAIKKLVYEEFRFIEEPSVAPDTISPETINSIATIIENPGSWSANAEHNYRLVEKYRSKELKAIIHAALKSLYNVGSTSY